MKNMVLKKISTILILIIILNIILITNTYALSISNLISDAQHFLLMGDSVERTIRDENLKETSNYIFKILITLAMITAIVIGIIIGIKFMTSSAEERAEVQKTLIIYVIGCFIVFSAFGIWSIVVNTGQHIAGEIDLKLNYNDKYNDGYANGNFNDWNVNGNGEEFTLEKYQEKYEEKLKLKNYYINKNELGEAAYCEGYLQGLYEKYIDYLEKQGSTNN